VAASLRKLAGLSMLATLAVQVPAHAHHMMGGRTPTTFTEGFLSGIGHPVIGLDHFAAIVGVGMLAALARRNFSVVLAFSAAMMVGVSLHLSRADIPAAELLAGLATLAVGGLVLVRLPVSSIAAVGLFAIAGLLHGYLLAESMVGAEPSPIIAYLAGLLVIQTAVAGAAFVAVRRLMRSPIGTRSASLLVAGGLVALMGGIAVAQAAGL
jgi:urease accessory protein